MKLEGINVTVVIGGRDVIGAASPVCRPGSLTALVGPSGSGKTTLLHCLGLLQTASSGQVLLDGVDTTSWKDSRRRRFWRDQAAFVLQDYGVMEEESVAFNVTMSSSLIGHRVRGDRGDLLAALEQTGLAGRENERAAHLSGGEKQRLAVARAIYKDAQVIYVDEPTASLDEDNRRRVIDLFTERARRGCTVVVSTHDEEMIAACDSHYSLGAAPHPDPVALPQTTNA